MAASSGEKILAYKLLEQERCPECNAKNSLRLIVLLDLIRILFVPFASAGKSGEIRCGNCRYKLGYHSFPPTYMKEYKELKKTTRTPLWAFSGILFISLFPLGAFFFRQMSPDHKPKPNLISEQLSHPVKLDRYHYKVQNDLYTWMIVDSVFQDTVLVRMNTHSTPIKAGLSAIANKPYDSIQFQLHVSDLDSMYKERKILKVFRKKH